MKLSKSEIRREIEKISSSYSTGEIFSSPYLNEILQAIVTSACESLNRIPQVESICDPSSDFTACTEGTRVMINTLGPLIRERDTNWDKYTNVVGHVIHECGHVLFTDFIEQMKPVAAESYRVLKKDKFCAVLMGDTRQKGHMVPVSFDVMKVFQDAGFKLKELIIKEQHNCKATGYWKTNSVKYNFLLIAHEYLFVFRK